MFEDGALPMVPNVGPVEVPITGLCSRAERGDVYQR